MPTMATRKTKPKDSLIPKALLARRVAQIIEDRELTQTEAARIARDAASQMSLIVSGKLDGFSAERLLRVLSRLGDDIEIRISRAAGKTGKVRLTVK